VTGAILLVELAGAVADWLDKHFSITIPWTTISGMVGHLEELWPTTAVFVVGIIAPAAVYALAPPPSHRRTPRGRWLLRSGDVRRARWYGAPTALALSAVVGLIAVLVFDDDYHRAEVIYGALFFFGIVVPSLLPLVRLEPGFTALFATIQNLRRQRNVVAWLATVALSGGMAILIVHLAFYPWPDITKEPVSYAGRTAKEARKRAVARVRQVRPEGGLVYSTQARQVVNGKEAWVVFFLGADESDAGCTVILKEDSVAVTPECSQ